MKAFFLLLMTTFCRTRSSSSTTTTTYTPTPYTSTTTIILLATLLKGVRLYQYRQAQTAWENIGKEKLHDRARMDKVFSGLFQLKCLPAIVTDERNVWHFHRKNFTWKNFQFSTSVCIKYEKLKECKGIFIRFCSIQYYTNGVWRHPQWIMFTIECICRN